MMLTKIGTSPHLSVGPDALISIMVGSAVRDELKLNPLQNPADIASSIGLITGIHL